MSLGGIIQDLRHIKILVVIPDDQERADLVRHLKRIGCLVDAIWPPPVVAPPCNALFFAIGDSSDISWIGAQTDAARIAVLDSEVPTLLKALIDSSAHGVLMRPLRAAGVLSNLVLALSLHGYERRLNEKVSKVEENLKSRRDVEKAIRVVMALRNLDEDNAYQFIRKQATSKRVPVAAVATSIIKAQELLNGLDLMQGSK